MDGILGVVDTAVTSPWFYLVLFAVAAIDGFFPVVPSESLVITAGVYAASGRPEPVLVVVLAALGAFTGDHVSFLLGRRAGGRWVRGLRPGTRRHAAFGWARRTMAERGGLILVVARYVPGGRTAVTVTMGAVGYPLRWFSLFAAVAAVSWGLYGTLLGYVGGVAFEDDPVKGVAVGLGLALSVTAAVEGVRFARRRRAATTTPDPKLEPATPGAEPEPATGTATGTKTETGTGMEPGARWDGDRVAGVGPLSGG